MWNKKNELPFATFMLVDVCQDFNCLFHILFPLKKKINLLLILSTAFQELFVFFWWNSISAKVRDPWIL